jgi:RNA polymerase sigma factor for flagellar operon FliA
VPCSVDAPAATVEGLISEHLGLVGHIARETAARLPRHLDTDDLLGAGALALVQAAHSFDPSLGVPFERFAATRVRGAMLDQMRQRDWATRSVRSRARALNKVSEELTGALQRIPTDTELAAASGLSVPEVRAVRENTDRAAVLSLDPLTGGDSSSIGALQDSSPRPDEVLIAAERVGYLRDAVAELPARTRTVVAGYYLEHRPLTDIAAELGVTQSRTSQLRSEGLELLRQALSHLLHEGTDGHPDPGEQTSVEGVRARRRDAYVDAVAKRSDVRSRADVEAYLRGSTMGERPGKASGQPRTPGSTPAPAPPYPG